jgi:hypothetical protein
MRLACGLSDGRTGAGTLTGCARHYSPDAVDDPYGFLSGVWHGLILAISVGVNVLSCLLGLVGISFLDSVQIVGQPNTGFGYWAGFVLAVVGVGGGGSR